MMLTGVFELVKLSDCIRLELFDARAEAGDSFYVRYFYPDDEDYALWEDLL